MAPRPFSHAWGGGSGHSSASPAHPTHWLVACPCLSQAPTSWYFSRATLVSAPSWVSMKSSLFLWMFSRMPWGDGGQGSGHRAEHYWPPMKTFL